MDESLLRRAEVHDRGTNINGDSGMKSKLGICVNRLDNNSALLLQRSPCPTSRLSMQSRKAAAHPTIRYIIYEYALESVTLIGAYAHTLLYALYVSGMLLLSKSCQYENVLHSVRQKLQTIFDITLT